MKEKKKTKKNETHKELQLITPMLTKLQHLYYNSPLFSWLQSYCFVCSGALAQQRDNLCEKVH